jgi:hypothetical protein
VRGELAVPFSDKPIIFQSELERNFISICIFASEVSGLVWEPFHVRYFDLKLNRFCIYTPDYLVDYVDERGNHKRLLVEVKSENDFRKTIVEYRARYFAAQRWANEQPNCKFRVATDSWMTQKGLSNIQLINAHRNLEVPQKTVQYVRKQVIKHPGTSLGSLTQRLQQGRAEGDNAFGTIMALMAARTLWFDIGSPLTTETKIYESQGKRIFR